MHEEPRQETEETVMSPSRGPRRNDEAGGWASSLGWSSGNAAASAQAWLSQLQAIIDNLATQSAPVIREVGAKAAEIAALAAERAGPLAQRAAEATAQASVRVAGRSRVLAADLRRGPDGGPGAVTAHADPLDSTDSSATHGAALS